MFPFILLILVSLFPLGALFHPGLPLTHDGPDHVARIANFYQSLSEGTIIPRWAGNLNWGYGHPILMFLYPLPSYVASLFHWLSFSLVDSTKLVFALSYMVSALSMYLWLRRITGVWGALTGALLYIYAPYRFVDLYVRGAIGEHVAFAVAPFVFYGIHLLATEKRGAKKPVVITSLSLAALLLSHNAISLMFLPVALLYGLYISVYEAKKRSQFLTLCVSSFALGFSLSAFFWLPALIEGKYTLRHIVTAGEYAGRFVPWAAFIIPSWSYAGSGELSKNVGLVQWIGIVLSLLVLKSIKTYKMRLLVVACVVVFFTSLFLQVSTSKFIWSLFPLLQSFQFPWRFLTLSVFSSSVVGALVFARLKDAVKPYVFGGLVIVLFVLTKHMWKPAGFIQKPESYYSTIYNGTTDTGESSPVWSVRFMEKRFGAPLEVIEGVAQITQITRRSTRHEYMVTASKNTRLVDNTLYFPGWRVTTDDKETDIQFQDQQYRGLMTFWVKEGTHRVAVVFTDTKVRKVSNAISFLSFVIVGSFFLKSLWKRIV